MAGHTLSLTAILRCAQNATVQLEPLHQIITLLMMPKHLIVSSQELRREVIPLLNGLQVKQVLAMYTPTGRTAVLSVNEIDQNVF